MVERRRRRASQTTRCASPAPPETILVHVSPDPLTSGRLFVPLKDAVYFGSELDTVPEDCRRITLLRTGDSTAALHHSKKGRHDFGRCECSQ